MILRQFPRIFFSKRNEKKFMNKSIDYIAKFFLHNPGEDEFRKFCEEYHLELVPKTVKTCGRWGDIEVVNLYDSNDKILPNCIECNEYVSCNCGDCEHTVCYNCSAHHDCSHSI